MNQYNTSFIIAFLLLLVQTPHVFKIHCIFTLCIHALRTCCQLWSTLQYVTFSLWFHVLTTSDCINPTNPANSSLWAPHSQARFMRSTPSQWILPRNFILGLSMHVSPPLTWWYSYMHSLYLSGTKFLCMSGFSHSMILILWLLHILRFTLTCMQIHIPLKR